VRRCAGECDFRATCFRGFRGKRYEDGKNLFSLRAFSSIAFQILYSLLRVPASPFVRCPGHRAHPVPFILNDDSPVEPFQRGFRFQQILLHFFAPVEDGAIPRRTKHVLVQRPLAPLALRPQPVEVPLQAVHRVQGFL